MHATRHVIARPFVLYPNDKKEDAKSRHFRPAISPCKLYFLQEFSGYVTWFSGEVVRRVGLRRGFPIRPAQSIPFGGQKLDNGPLTLPASPAAELLCSNPSLGVQMAPGTSKVTNP